MPEINEQMYCSEQINIPPPFPYLLRQFAKAAIRTQPIDLLKWSTAYFRCLSLNIPPPVKPRLEYPIPRDYYGITPGWIKTLMFQLQGSETVNFKILWDRWTGACLAHDTLIKVLCLGGFNNPSAIPWFRFVGLCAAHLTENLTESMKLICEILTEEPEGGSATIRATVFLDLYKFLAAIDASKPQILKNLYFTDSLLSLWKEKRAEVEKPKEDKEESIIEEASIKAEESSSTSHVEIEKAVSKETISCPSLAGDDDYSIHLSDYALKDVDEEAEEEEGMHEPEAKEEETVVEEEQTDAEGEKMAEEEEEEKHEPSAAPELHSDEDEEQQKIHHMELEGEGAEEEHKEEHGEGEEKVEEDEKVPVVEEESVDVIESAYTIIEEPPTIQERFFEDDEKALQEDLARLKALQSEIAGETDEEVEKFKCRLIEEMPLSGSQLAAIEAYKEAEKKEEVMEGEVEMEEHIDERQYEDVYIDAIPGIGPIVPEELVKAVCEYIQRVAGKQHGMVMPRNIRSYECPPLEEMDED